LNATLSRAVERPAGYHTLCRALVLWFAFSGFQ
jgi:hypothetical protein